MTDGCIMGGGGGVRFGGERPGVWGGGQEGEGEAGGGSAVPVQVLNSCRTFRYQMWTKQCRVSARTIQTPP